MLAEICSGRKELIDSKSAKILPFSSVTAFAADRALPMESLTRKAFDSKWLSPVEMELPASPSKSSPCEMEPENAEEKSPAAFRASLRMEMELSRV